MARRLACNFDRGVPTSVPVKSYVTSAEHLSVGQSFLLVLGFPLAILIPQNDLFLSHLSPGADAVAHFRCKYQGA